MKIKRICEGFYPKDLVTFDNGIKREIVHGDDSVAILLYDIENKGIILVRQERAAMLFRRDSYHSVYGGFIIESVAGRLDKPGKTIKQIAKEEAMEEAGADVSEDDIEIINFGESLAPSPGFSTECIYLAYAEIKPGKLPKAKPEQIFGIEEEGERIARVCFPVEDLENYPHKDLKTFALIQWFLRTKLKK